MTFSPPGGEWGCQGSPPARCSHHPQSICRSSLLNTVPSSTLHARAWQIVLSFAAAAQEEPLPRTFVTGLPQFGAHAAPSISPWGDHLHTGDTSPGLLWPHDCCRSGWLKCHLHSGLPSSQRHRTGELSSPEPRSCKGLCRNREPRHRLLGDTPELSRTPGDFVASFFFFA